MTNIPASAREFERWYEERKSDWPQELQDAGMRALLTLKMMVGQAREHAQSAALMEAATKDLLDFAQAYGAWAKR